MNSNTAQMLPPASLHGHWPALDGLRGIAILAVLFHQFGELGVAPGLFEYLVRYAMGAGWAGVQLFYVLSGFLITGILLDTRLAGNYLGGFLARRCLRIFPLYFTTLIVAFILLPLVGIDSPSLAADRPHQAWLWSYTENWAIVLGAGSKTFPHYWSLAVEEQFYLIWPLLLWRRTPLDCFRLCIAIALASLLVRGMIAWLGLRETEIYYYPSICRADALALGGAAAAAFRIAGWRQWIIAQRSAIAIVVGAAALVGALATHGYSIFEVSGQTAGYSIVALLFAAVIAVAAADDTSGDASWRRVLRLRPLQSIGKYSYAMYIFHKPLHDHVGRPLLVSCGFNLRLPAAYNLVYILVATIVVYAIAFASYHLFEKHFLQLKRLFAPTAADV